MSWKPAIKTVGSDKWGLNGLAFATEKEAQDWGFDLLMRWIGAEEHEAQESADPVSHTYIDGKLEPLK
jgi:hypothetical protein